MQVFATVNSGFKCCYWNMVLWVINCFMQGLFPLTDVIQTPHHFGFIYAPFLHIESCIHSLRLGLVSLTSILLDLTVYFTPFQEIIFDSKYEWKIYYLEKLLFLLGNSYFCCYLGKQWVFPLQQTHCWCFYSILKKHIKVQLWYPYLFYLCFWMVF